MRGIQKRGESLSFVFGPAEDFPAEGLKKMSGALVVSDLF